MIRINDNTASSRIRFNSLAEHYLKADFGADAVRPKSENTTASRSISSESHLQGRHTARAGKQEPCDARRNTMQIQLPGYRHHPDPGV
jgi:hypothetical protein